MSKDELNSKIRRLEDRGKHLEHYPGQVIRRRHVGDLPALPHHGESDVRVEDLAEVVEKFAGPDSRNREVFAHIRPVADKARVSGWNHGGP